MDGNKAEICPLCGSETVMFYESRQRTYLRCGSCLSVMLSPEYYLSEEDEKKRYELHENDPDDPGYRDSVKTIVNAVRSDIKLPAHGLDFGSGPDPATAKMLRELGYTIDLYDPFFHKDPDKLKRKYDFIVCCEVIEHFKNPAEEFRSLSSLIKLGGLILCQTEIYGDDIEFPKWHYKNDATHIFFYHHKAFEWIRDNCGFSGCQVKGKVIVFAG